MTGKMPVLLADGEPPCRICHYERSEAIPGVSLLDWCGSPASSAGSPHPTTGWSFLSR